MKKLNTLLTSHLQLQGRLFFSIPFIYLSALGFTYAQSGDPFVNVIPPPPETASLMKYEEIPVDLHSGLPNINIPLGSISDGKLNLPVTLRYHADIRPSQVASRLGTGWDISCEFAITRTTHGMIDEWQGQGFLDYINSTYVNNNFLNLLLGDNGQGHSTTEVELDPLYRAYRDGNLDFEPDVFHISGPFGTAKFSFDWDGEIVLHSAIPLEISYTIEEISSPDNAQFTYNAFTSFTVIDGTGNVYLYSAMEYSDVIESGTGDISPAWMSYVDIPNAWKLTRIEDHSGTNCLSFEYQQYSYQFRHRTTDLYMETIGGNPACSAGSFLNVNLALTKIIGQKLERIVSCSGLQSIEFVAVTPRDDLPLWNQGGNKLDTIKFYGIDSDSTTSWIFNYENTQKLFLKSVQQFSGDYQQSTPGYDFIYENESDFPIGYTTPAIDHWGYYNLETANSHTAPTTTFYDNRIHDFNTIILANREPNFNGSRIGVLNKISYPSGYCTEFVWEGNDYGFEKNSFLTKESVTRNDGFTLQASYTSAVGGGSQITNQSFTFNDVNSPLHLSWTISVDNGPDGFGPATGSNVKILDSNGGIVFSSLPGTYNNGDYLFEEDINLPTGSFELIVSSGIILIGSCQVSATVNWVIDVETVADVQPAGGVRVKQIIDSDCNGGSELVRNITYLTQHDGFTTSSGVINHEKYAYGRITEYVCSTSSGSGGPLVNLTDVRLMVYSENQAALGPATGGRPVGYKEVTVSYGNNGEFGKSVFHYTSAYEYGDYKESVPPFIPASNYMFKRGKLVEEEHFKFTGFLNNNGEDVPQYELLQKIESEYSFFENYTRGIKVGLELPGGGITGPGGNWRYAVAPYANYMGYDRLDRSYDTLFYSGNDIGTFTSYSYDETYKVPTRKTNYDSEGNRITQHTLYSQDLDDTDPAKTLLMDKHMYGLPVSTVSVMSDKMESLWLLSANKSIFEANPNNPAQVVSTKVQVAPLEDALSVTSTGDAIQKAGFLFEDIALFTYDDKGNVLEQTMRDGLTNTYLWGHNQSLPLAGVTDAHHNEVYYNGFEDATAIINNATRTLEENVGRSGSKSLQFQTGGYYCIQELPQIAGDYILSWWKKEGADWEYVERQYENYSPGSSMCITKIVGLIDDIMAYPVGAQFSYLNYGKYGASDMTDTNNRTTYFERDGFGRLIIVRDKDKNIVTISEYKYARDD